MGKFIDLTGKRFGCLVVKNFVGFNKYKTSKWLCLCDCGAECYALASSLGCGNKKSCGDKKHKRIVNRVEFDNCCAYIYVSGREQPAIIDKEDYQKIKEFHWNNEKPYSYTTSTVQSNKKKKIIRLHRLILGIDDENIFVDHINGNPLDNRKTNLRTATIQQNSYNHKVRSNNTSGATGVKLIKKNNTWNARIVINKKEISLGCYKTFEEAVKARKDAEIKYFGEYRR